MSELEGRQRVVIERVRPQVDCGRYPAKAVIGEEMDVSADVFTDGHDRVNARVLFRHESEKTAHAAPMKPVGQDRWRGSFKTGQSGMYLFTVEGWIDHFVTWQADLQKRVDAGQDVRTELKIGADLVREAIPNAYGADSSTLKEIAAKLENPDNMEMAIAQALGTGLRDLMSVYAPRHWATTYDGELAVRVEPAMARFSSWYEIFPRSFCGGDGEHGSFKGCLTKLDEIAAMGFDIVYLPPIHPIGETNRKGKNNQREAQAGDPGSPWAIGSKDGGHKAIHPQLGTMDDFKAFVARARELGMEVALDLAFQCSLDHPYVKEHPEWFKWRPDGSIQYAENPPKKYEDIVPFDFECDQWRQLWEELQRVVEFWIDKGVRIFRVDNP
ncbi:DUF3416 domain-containing protein, partial [candidate division GN15 bacterium]|nr:DUF3416 domain-containing protein [candidate division GN15 bacterium]